MASRRKVKHTVIPKTSSWKRVVCWALRHQPRPTYDPKTERMFHRCRRCGQKTVGWNRDSRYI